MLSTTEPAEPARLTRCELQPGADLVDGCSAAEPEETETEDAGPHGPQRHSHQHCHRVEGRQRRQVGQTAATVRDRPVRVHAHLSTQDSQQVLMVSEY